MPQNKNYKVRILNASEFDREDLIKIFSDNKSLVPYPLNAHIQIAENDDGKIVALAVLQPQYHLEPIWVDPEYRSTPVHKEVVKGVLNIIQSIKGLKIFAFSPDDKIARLCVRFGFKYKSYEVFMKEF